MYKCVWQRETENGFVIYIVSTEISENRFSLLYIESVQNIYCELCDKIFFVSFRIFAFLEGFACFSRAILWSKFYYAIVILTLWNCNVHGSIIMRENVSICVIQSVSGTQFHLPTRLAELKSTIYFDVISQMMSSIECNFKLIRCIKNELLT